MTRAQFLNDLYRRLGALTQEQAEQHLTYYAEMLADRMEEGMSEEEAVASMEDVGTIAHRILQEEAVQPPRYPEPPAMEKRMPEPAAKASRNWRRPAAAALWALALLVAGGAIFGRIFGLARSTLHDGSSSEQVEEVSPLEQIDHGISIGPDGIQVGGVYIGPDGIQVDGKDRDASDWIEWADGYDGWDGGYTVWGNTGSVPADGIEKIEVEWLAGEVEILPGGREITFAEASASEIDVEEQMTYQIKGKTLTIQFRESKHNDYVGENNAKLLTLTIPGGVLNKLCIETVSADVNLNNLEVDELDVNTVSGNVTVTEFCGQKMEVQTISGVVDIYPIDVRDIEVDTASGDIYLDMEYSTLPEISLDTISGDMTLILQEEMGFSLEFETVSGELDTGGFRVIQRDKKYVSGDGSCEIDVESTSGDLTLICNN